MNFDEWFLSNGIPLDTDFNVAKRAFEAGKQSQQAKIDLLEKELTETQAFLNKQNHIKQAKIDELQRKINEIVDLVCNNTPDYYLDNMIEEIIKGNKDEN